MYIVEVYVLEFLDTVLSFQVQVLCFGSVEQHTKAQDGVVHLDMMCVHCPQCSASLY